MAKDSRKAVITIGTVISVMGGMAIGIAWVVAYVNTAVAPVSAQTNLNTANIAGLIQKTDDTNDKVNQLYDYFITKGLQPK